MTVQYHLHVTATIHSTVMKKLNKARYKATKVHCGWAGAVRKHAKSSIWAAAVMQKTPKNAKKCSIANVQICPKMFSIESCVHWRGLGKSHYYNE